MPLQDVEHQPHALESLRRALAGGRLHHAYLFTGPAGVGKALAAQGMAEALLCSTPGADGDACGQCNPCQRAASGQHADLHRVARASKSDGTLQNQIKIDQVRALQRALTFKSFEGTRRVVLLIEPEKMNPATANALLKTLEEPGKDTHFILVSDAAHRLLPTIVSRCQRVRFAPLPRTFVSGRLMAECELSVADAELVAGLAEGSLGNAIELAKSDILTDRRVYIDGVDGRATLGDVPDRLEMAEKLAKKKPELPIVLHLLRTWYRDVLLIQSGAPIDRVVHQDRIADLRQRARTVSGKELIERLERINDAESRIFENNANVRLTLEALLVRLAGKSMNGRAA